MVLLVSLVALQVRVEVRRLHNIGHTLKTLLLKGKHVCVFLKPPIQVFLFHLLTLFQQSLAYISFLWFLVSPALLFNSEKIFVSSLNVLKVMSVQVLL